MSLQNSLNEGRGTRLSASPTGLRRSCSFGRQLATSKALALLPSWEPRSPRLKASTETTSMLAPFSSSIFLLGSRGTHIGFCLGGRSHLGGLALSLGLLLLGRGLLIHVIYFYEYQIQKIKIRAFGGWKCRDEASCGEVVKIDG